MYENNGKKINFRVARLLRVATSKNAKICQKTNINDISKTVGVCRRINLPD